MSDDHNPWSPDELDIARSIDALAAQFGRPAYGRDRQGDPIDFQDWARLRAQPDYVRVAIDKAGKYTVVTNWLGTTARLKIGPEHIFETYSVREGVATQKATYVTEAEAVAGHRKIVLAHRIVRGVTLGLMALGAFVVGALVWLGWVVVR